MESLVTLSCGHNVNGLVTAQSRRMANTASFTAVLSVHQARRQRQNRRRQEGVPLPLPSVQASSCRVS